MSLEKFKLSSLKEKIAEQAQALVPKKKKVEKEVKKVSKKK